MKKIIVISAALASLMSCRKDVKSLNQNISTDKRLVEYRSVVYPIENASYIYDENGKLVIAENGYNKWQLTYEPGKIIFKLTEKSTATLLAITEYELNAKGSANRVVGKSANGEWVYTRTLTYDSEGYLVKSLTENSSGIPHEVEYTVSNGNVIKEITKNGGVLQNETDYTYNMDVTDRAYKNIASTWPIDNLFGKGLANEIRSYKTYNGAGALIFETTINVEQDANGYVVKRTEYHPITNLTFDYLFIYQ